MAGEERVWIRRNYEKCSGCRRCEITCSLNHEGRIWPEASRIRVFMLIPGVEIPNLLPVRRLSLRQNLSSRSTLG